VAVLALMAGLVGCAGVARDATAPDPALEDLNRGRLYSQLGLTQSALEAFSDALAKNPKLVEAHMGMGALYRRAGDYERASGCYEIAARLAPLSFDAHYYLGLTKQLLGKLQEAARAYQAALAINPYSFEANQNLSGAYLQLGRAQDALPYAITAASMRSDDAGCWANLGAVHSLLGRYKEAAEAYDRAIALGAPGEVTLAAEADALIHLGDYARAAERLRERAKSMPSALIYERMGYAYFKLGKTDEALDAYHAALQRDGNDTAALNGVGVCLMTQYISAGLQDRDLRDQALEAWHKSLQVRPDQPQIATLIRKFERA
jgi:tetratricopeptide (TPR) repeat protein